MGFSEVFDSNGLEVEQVHEKVGARSAVNGRMVHFGDNADAVLFETFDDPHFP